MHSVTSLSPGHRGRMTRRRRWTPCAFPPESIWISCWKTSSTPGDDPKANQVHDDDTNRDRATCPAVCADLLPGRYPTRGVPEQRRFVSPARLAADSAAGGAVRVDVRREGAAAGTDRGQPEFSGEGRGVHGPQGRGRAVIASVDAKRKACVSAASLPVVGSSWPSAVAGLRAWRPRLRRPVPEPTCA